MVADWLGSLLQWEGELQRLKARLGAALPRRELREPRALSWMGCFRAWNARRAG